ncbi:MAG: hypothetical protein GXP31_02660 [Kiritimatiellaeota bacterium]|nr:hypothetical protein [Kiritimatiellota bacterium]
MPSPETPMGLALLICDVIIEDKLTGKKSLVGLFDRIHARVFPCVHASMAVFVSLTSGHGKYPCEILCRHTDGKTTAFSAKGAIVMPDPSKVVDLVFRLNGVRFPKPGTYWVHFLADEMPIMMRPLQILRVKEQAPPAGK